MNEFGAAVLSHSSLRGIMTQRDATTDPAPGYAQARFLHAMAYRTADPARRHPASIHSAVIPMQPSTSIDNPTRRTISLAIALAGLLSLLLWPAQHPQAGEIESVERLRDTVATYLSAITQTTGTDEIEVLVGQIDARLRLARCDRTPNASLAPGARTSGSTTVNLRCSKPVQWSIFVPARIERHTQVVVVARPIAREQRIQATDLRRERQEVSSLSGGYFRDPNAVIGMEARRALTPGQVITSAHVAPRKLVERGQLVTIYSGDGGLMVRMSGEALEDGAAGERIRVRNRSSRRIVEGYVEPSGHIHVPL
ncbi:flagellar basal body P-ring formation chaperone FlgA [Marichromatium gracile]|uniref:Flagella basal body P-ring formation protein FlgA n=2 Tax=Marichromatium gracile TaxID=1048 RepID=A0A4R4A5E4_MARGR|nr:flagellar basal body P-ring formation chaperone FlgA [Marichromatium gracile]TCW33440.1 flagella basal body P-ring formation protein FlgA [Marichromatium gracile]